MINFPTLVNYILESEEDKQHGQRTGGLTGKSFEPKGFGKTSAIRGIGLYNREREDRYEFDPSQSAATLGAAVPSINDPKKQVQLTQDQAQAETRQLEKKAYLRLAMIFGVINGNPELKQQSEQIISKYMEKLRAAQALKQRIGRHINDPLKAMAFRPGPSDQIGAPDLRPGESDGSVKTTDKDSKHAVDIAESETLVNWLERNDHIIYEEFVDFAVEAVAPVLKDRKVEKMKQAAIDAKNADSSEIDEESIQDKMAEHVRGDLERLYDTRLRAYEKSKESYVRGGRGMYYGINTPVSTLASWLNSATARVGAEQERAMRNVVTYHSSKNVLGKITHIPEGQKIKRLLDIVDEVQHGLSQDAENTSRFHTPGRDKEHDERLAKKSFRSSTEFNELKQEANEIVSDLDVLLGSGQFELFKLVNSFFNDEEGAEGALKRFVLNDVVASFNS